MTARLFRVIVAGATLIACAALMALLILTTPAADDPLPTITVIGTVSVALVGLVAFLTSLLWCRGDRCATDHTPLLRSLRHGMLCGAFVAAIMALQWRGILVWWTALLASGPILLMEAYVWLIMRRG